MFEVTKALLAKAGVVVSEATVVFLNAAFEKCGILSKEAVLYSLSNMIHETGGFKKFAESLYYSDPERAARIFLTAFDANKDRKISPQEIEAARPYTKNSEKMANKVYAGRYGNGNEASGDGYKFRGSGPIQLTFRDNFARCSKELFGDDRLVRNPDWVRDASRIECWLAGAWFCKNAGVNSYAAKGDFSGFRGAVNTAKLGLSECRAAYDAMSK